MITRTEGEPKQTLTSDAVTIRNHAVKAVIEQTIDGRYHLAVYRITKEGSGADQVHEERHLEEQILVKRLQRYGLLPKFVEDSR
jgi:hypothetical protein